LQKKPIVSLSLSFITSQPIFIPLFYFIVSVNG
jgi:hypothetical protein